MLKKVILFISCLFFLVGCSSKNNEDLSNTKTSAELENISTEIISLLNGLNNISLDNYTLEEKSINLSKDNNQSSQKSDENENDTDTSSESEIKTTRMEEKGILTTNYENINWNSLKTKIELINDSWNVIILDLYNSNINKTDLFNFEKLLDTSILNIKNEDKINSITSLANLYSYIPKFYASVDQEESKANIEATKEYILYSYMYVNQDNWNEANTNILTASETFSKVFNDTNYTNNKEFKINKIYILIQELQSGISNQDKTLYYVKYKNLMDNINTL